MWYLVHGMYTLCMHWHTQGYICKYMFNVNTFKLYLYCDDYWLFFSSIPTDSCIRRETCLAPTIAFSSSPRVPEYTCAVTSTSIEIWWGTTQLPGCCAENVFSYPLIQYRYQISSGSGGSRSAEVSEQQTNFISVCQLYVYVKLWSNAEVYSNVPRTCKYVWYMCVPYTVF